MSKKLPSMQFYPGDWMKDPALRACTLEARGLWTDMLCLMFESPRRGYLQHATGKPVTPDQLARMTGCTAEQVSRLLRELEDAGVYSCTEHGVIFSRRLARDEAERSQIRERVRRARQREGEDCNGRCNADVTPDVTPMKRRSSSSSSVSTSRTSPPTPQKGDGGGDSALPETAKDKPPPAIPANWRRLLGHLKIEAPPVPPGELSALAPELVALWMQAEQDKKSGQNIRSAWRVALSRQDVGDKPNPEHLRIARKYLRPPPRDLVCECGQKLAEFYCPGSGQRGYQCEKCRKTYEL